MTADKVNILLVDDQPAKLLSYEVILEELGENLIKATSAKQALEILLKTEVAVVLIDVYMPELDGFELAQMIRDHPRFQQTAIIFISAVLLGDLDRLRGYELGGVDYVPVPVIPEVLRAKVRVFAELFRRGRALQQLNEQLEQRVEERTAELATSNVRFLESEQRRSLALAAGQMGAWDWDIANDCFIWDEGQYRIFGVDPEKFSPTMNNIEGLIHPDDWPLLKNTLTKLSTKADTAKVEFRIHRPNGDVRWCIGAGASTPDAKNKIVRVSGVTLDITERKEAEERQVMLVREVDHRARNALAVAQSIVRLTRAATIEGYITAVQGRIAALARTHTLLAEARWRGADLRALIDEEMAPFRSDAGARIAIEGPQVSLPPAIAQSLALMIHELVTNAVKHGALSSPQGHVALNWQVAGKNLHLSWIETGGPPVKPPASQGFGSKIMKATIGQQLRGTLNMDWREQGLVSTFSFALHDGEPQSLSPAKPKVAAAPSRVKIPQGARVLLVEDEAMVGMMIADFLTEIGYRVVGPFSKTSEGLAAARNNNFEAAVLDVNINGEPVYPVAECLTDRNIPFVFVTGYGADSIDARFAQAPVLQKPVEREMLRNALAPN